MTPYTLLTPTTEPSLPPVSKDTSRDVARNSRDSKAVSSDKASSKSDLTADNKNNVSETDSTLFEELMASLLNMPSPAQTPTVTVKPIANDSTAVSSATSTSTPATPQFGVAFNMDPALLVIPQDVNATSLTSQTGSFSAELLAALTPGVPSTEVSTTSALPTDAPVTVTVPVPVLASSETTTPALTVSSDVEADPRLVACGLDPAQMQVLKDKLAAANAAASQSQTNTSQPQNQNSATNQNSGPNDAGIITVTMGLDTTPQTPIQVKVQPQPQAPTTTPVAVTTEVAETLTSPTKPSETDTANTDSVPLSESGSEETISTDGSFDPVEFRIAQRFQRPVSTPGTQPDTPTYQSAAPATDQPPGAAVTSKTTAHTENATVKGKVDLAAGSSLPTATPAATGTVSFDALTATPSSLPVTVSTLTSTVAQSTTAAQSHPAIQTVAAVIAKGAKTEGPQTISMRLDPPELGKLQVEMKYKKGDPLKVHVVLEKADTASMFQRDAHALESALNDAGLQMDGSSLSFEFSQDGNAFKQAMQQDPSSQGQSSQWSDSIVSEATPIETSMDVYTDSKTGLTHYNIKA